MKKHLNLPPIPTDPGKKPNENSHFITDDTNGNENIKTYFVKPKRNLFEPSRNRNGWSPAAT